MQHTATQTIAGNVHLRLRPIVGVSINWSIVAANGHRLFKSLIITKKAVNPIKQYSHQPATAMMLCDVGHIIRCKSEFRFPNKFCYVFRNPN